MDKYIELSTALKIANKMCKPWQYATVVLTIVVAGLLYTIITTEIEADTLMEAVKVNADKLITDIKVKG